MKNNEHIIETFSEMAPNYEEIVNSELTRFWGLSYPQFINTLFELTPSKMEGKILDIATGTGAIPTKLIGMNGNTYQIHGLDITHSMLIHAKRNLTDINHQDSVKLTCASAMKMPYTTSSFDVVICGLATHHMDITLLLEEAHRILRPGGQLLFADVGRSEMWDVPTIKGIIRFLAFIYFVIKEGPNRAWAESSAISNVRTVDEWSGQLGEIDFINISIIKLKSRYRWIPGPLFIFAKKNGGTTE